MQWRWIGAAGLAAALAGGGLAFGGGKISGQEGRVTPDAVSHAGLEYALAYMPVEQGAFSRLDFGNVLVDFGAHIDADMGWGYDVHVHLNYEPTWGPRSGDTEVHVHVDYAGVAQGIISHWDPSLFDDMTIPSNGPNVLDKPSYRAVRAAYVDLNVDLLLQERFALGRELWDTDADVLSQGPEWSIQVRNTFRKPSGQQPPPGQRAVIAIVRVAADLSYAFVESYWTE